MDARSFFENSSMEEITVSATRDEWTQVMEDLRWAHHSIKLEPASYDLLSALDLQGVRS